MLNVAAVFSDHMVLQRELPIAIFGEADGPVRVELAGRSVEAVPEAGRFCATLPPMAAGGPYVLRVACGEEVRRFEDVMVGEVWLCGGQSNMEFVLRDDREGPTQVATGEDALLRFYTVNQEARMDAAMLARERATAWKPLAPGTCADVSAVAYYAGRRLREALGVPVGMLICCIGGSESACWISREELEGFPEGRERLEAFEAAIAGVSDEQYKRDDAAYTARVEAWRRAADAIKAAHPGIKATEMVRETGEFPWPPPMGRWMLRRPGGPWETMVRRITPFAARGLFWYQGETDSGMADTYAARLTRLIGQWREAFANRDLYFVAAQLPGYRADPAVEDWPGIRRAQQKVCDNVPRCSLVCLLDCGDSEDIHPWDKRTPGTRMANAALKVAYGVGPGAESPRVANVEPMEEGLLLRFTEPLAQRSGGHPGLRVNGDPARARITPDGALLIEARGPATVAYAQENDPQATLFGQSGLPALPFECRIGNE